MKRLYFNIDKDNKVILDRKDFNYLMSIVHYNDKSIDYINKHKVRLHHWFDEPDCDYWLATNPNELLDILKGSDTNENI